jgi:hypothetical protein
MQSFFIGNYNDCIVSDVDHPRFKYAFGLLMMMVCDNIETLTLYYHVYDNL